MSEGLVEYLYRALSSRFGIVVHTSDPERTRQRLYQARTKAQTPAFKELSITPSRSSPNSEIWIVRKTLSPKDSTDAPQED